VTNKVGSRKSPAEQRKESSRAAERVQQSSGKSPAEQQKERTQEESFESAEMVHAGLAISILA
jgi:hypothetical protein